MSGEVTTYTELIGAIDAQRVAMGMRQSDFDDHCGFPPGLWGKVSGILQVKRLGPEKCFDGLRGAGLRIRVEIDPEQLEKMQRRIAENYNPRQANQARPGHSASLPSTPVLNRVMQPWRKIGGKKRWHRTTKEERSAHMRMMAMAGVRKRKKKKRRADRAKRAAAAHRAKNAERGSCKTRRAVGPDAGVVAG